VRWQSGSLGWHRLLMVVILLPSRFGMGSLQLPIDSITQLMCCQMKLPGHLSSGFHPHGFALISSLAARLPGPNNYSGLSIPIRTLPSSATDLPALPTPLWLPTHRCSPRAEGEASIPLVRAFIQWCLTVYLDCRPIPTQIPLTISYFHLCFFSLFLMISVLCALARHSKFPVFLACLFLPYSHVLWTSDSLPASCRICLPD